MFFQRGQKVFTPRIKCFYSEENILFQALEYKFQALKHMFQALEYMFQALEQKILRGRRTFS